MNEWSDILNPNVRRAWERSYVMPGVTGRLDTPESQVYIGDVVRTSQGTVGKVEDVYRRRIVKVSGIVGYVNIESLTLVSRKQPELFNEETIRSKINKDAT